MAHKEYVHTTHRYRSKTSPREVDLYLPAGAGDVADDKLAATWVDVAPGGRQIPHNHPEVQIYIIINGRGRMLVGEEKKEVSAGELVYVPSGLMHGIENIGEGTLSYVSAATPAFDYTEAYDRGQLRDAAYEEK